jgi:D-cysteine desulfhydrase family pyridoxal phosphate-dependent enzyme
MREIPRVQFAHLPTLIEAMPRLTEKLKGPRLLVKRDDQTGLGLGGNKTRKLEFLLAEAQAQGAKTLITEGAVQSNHCRQTAAAAARFGFACTLVLTGEQPSRSSGNLLLNNLFGAELIFTDSENVEATMHHVFQEKQSQGKDPYLIPLGGSTPTGAVGYVFAMREVIEQGCNPDWIVLATGSGGTQAGLMVGARLFGFRGKILGISVFKPGVDLEKGTADLATRVADFLGEKISFDGAQMLINSDYTGKGYGIMGEAEKEAISLFARYEGLLLDPVYTGRAAAGMIDLIRKGFFKSSETVLFWHTGGTPALFADDYLQNLGEG